MLSGEFQVGDLAEADKHLETKQSIITRSFPAARLEDPPKCDQVFPDRRSARFPIQSVRTRWKGQNYPRFVRGRCLPGGYFALEPPPMNRGAAAERIIDLIPPLRNSIDPPICQEFRSVNRLRDLLGMISRANALGELKLPQKIGLP